MSERKKILHVRNKFEGDLIKIWNLPYDAEVEYLEAAFRSASSSITTNVRIPSANSIVLWEGMAMFNSQTEPANRQQFVASFNDTGHPTYCEFNNNGQFGANNWSRWYVTPLSDKLRPVSWSLQSDRAVYGTEIDGITYTSTCTQNVTMSVGNNFYFQLFRLANYGFGRGVRIGANKLTIDGELKLDLVPVRKNGIGYMYDKIEQKFYGGSANNSFIIGPDK